MPLALRTVPFMTADPARLADFWAAATGFTERRDGPDEILLAPADWGFPHFTSQRVAAPQASPGRLHLDLTADDMEAEIERLVGLGATRVRLVDRAESGSVTWTVMLDPDGNEFCVVQQPRFN